MMQSEKVGRGEGTREGAREGGREGGTDGRTEGARERGSEGAREGGSVGGREEEGATGGVTIWVGISGRQMSVRRIGKECVEMRECVKSK